MPREPLTIRLHPADNVVTAKETIAAGAALAGEGGGTADDIPVGHKVATAAIAAGEPVRKYNQIIGFASRPIAVGDHVHTHNVEVKTFARDYAPGSESRPTDFMPEAERATFEGILRDDGRAATRNYIGLVSSVNCSATVCRYIADAFRGDALADYPHVDGVVALTHGSGCGPILGAQNSLRSHLTASNSKTFSWGSMPQTPPSFCGHTNIATLGYLYR